MTSSLPSISGPVRREDWEVSQCLDKDFWQGMGHCETQDSCCWSGEGAQAWRDAFSVKILRASMLFLVTWKLRFETVQFFHNEVSLFKLGQWNKKQQPFVRRLMGLHTACPVLPCFSVIGFLSDVEGCCEICLTYLGKIHVKTLILRAALSLFWPQPLDLADTCLKG